MRVEVLLFASARGLAGRSRLAAELPEGSKVRAVLALPELAGLERAAASLGFAVNEEFSSPEAALRDGDVVAVLPPVSGG